MKKITSLSFFSKKNYQSHPLTNGSLSHRVVKSGFWVFLLRITNRGFSLIRLIILARILSPNDFGLLGIALLLMSSLETFSRTGLQIALVQKKEVIKSDLDATWTVLILRGFILFAILFLIAPYAAIFFETPQSKPIIQVIGISELFKAFTNIGTIYFQKDLEFHKDFIYQFSGTLTDFIVAVSAVLIFKNVWALVFGLLASNATTCFISYIIHPYRPHLSFDLGKVKELFSFGKWVFFSSILMFLITQGDDIFAGKLLGATALGLYQMAYKISNMPTTEITHLISRVTFPAYSKMQDNIPKLRESFLKVLQVSVFLSFIIGGLVFVLAPDFTMIFLGDKWMSMVPAMQVLVLWGVIRSIGATCGPIIYATGKPNILTKYQLLQLVLIIILIYPLSVHWGILGISLAVLIASIGANAPLFYSATKITNCGIYNFIRAIIFPLTNSLIAIMFIFLLKICRITPNVLIISFVLFLISYGLVYLGLSYLFDRFFGYKVLSLLKEIFSNLMKSQKADIG